MFFLMHLLIIFLYNLIDIILLGSFYLCVSIGEIKKTKIQKSVYSDMHFNNLLMKFIKFILSLCQYKLKKQKINI